MAEGSDVKERQTRLLAESLAAMRVAGKADVIMVCGQKEFYAHKLVLEARSPYFTAMFRSNLKEANSGKVVFNTMEPETLEAILDFLYLGEVKKMNTEDQLRKVLDASHMMELQELFQYCCRSLLKMLPPQNFFVTWTLAERYSAERMLAEVKNYFLENCIQILTSNNFLTATVNQLKHLVVIFKSKFRNIDRMLKGIVLWLAHDLAAREQFTDELFAFVEADRVSTQFAKSFLEGSELKTTSEAIANRLKDIGIKVILADKKEFSGGVENTEISKIAKNLPKPAAKCITNCNYKLFFLTQQCAVKLGPGSSKPEENFESYIQQFDLQTMTWQPMKYLPSVSFKVDVMCEYNGNIYFTGSTAGNVDVRYDVRKNTVQYVATENSCTTRHASAICFKNEMYVIGGDGQFGTTPRCRTYHSGIYTWVKTSPLKVSRVKPVLFATQNYLFVTGGCSLSDNIIEHTNGNKNWQKDSDGIGFYSMKWTIVEISTDFIRADVYFFPCNDQLCGVSNFKGYRLKLMYNDGKWDVQEYPKEHQTSGWYLTTQLYKKLKVKRSAVFQTPNSPFVFITTTDYKIGIPNYTVDLTSGEWTRLPEPRGICEIKNWSTTLTATYNLP